MKNLPALTGLRFFAAAAIVLHHLVGHFGISGQWLQGANPAQGVSVFFVLSGFILTYQHSPTLAERTGLRFLALRAARIYPSHLTMLGFYILLFGYEGDALRLLANALLLQSWSPDGSFYFAYNAVSWSISTEMAFYAAFPLVLLGVRGHPVAMLLAVGCASFSMALLSHHLDLPVYAPASEQWTLQGLVMVNPIARLLEFVSGMVAALVFTRTGSARPLSVWTASVVEGVAIAALLWNVSLAEITYYTFSTEIGNAGNFWFNMCFMPIIPAAMLMIVLARGEGVFSWFLALRSVQYLGAISFATYLVHMVMIRVVAERFEGMTGLMIFLLATLLASVALHELVERPAQRVLRRMILPLTNAQRSGPAVVAAG